MFVFALYVFVFFICFGNHFSILFENDKRVEDNDK